MSLIILDRDGVINHDSDYYIKSPDEWLPIPGSLDAIARLNQHGYRVVVATNQSGIARGHYDVAMLDSIHEKMKKLLAEAGGHVEDIFYCPHHPDEQCECRKPQPGMLLQIQKKYDINLADTYFIGDSYTDVQAAHAVKCKPLLVLTGKGQLNLAKYPILQKEASFADLSKAVAFIVSNQSD